jgi:hypothetical protein
MKKGFSTVGVIIAIAILGVIGVGTWFVIDGNNKATNFENYDFYSIIQPDVHNGNIGDHVKGNKDAKTIIFEYADFQCPGCASMNARVNAAINNSDGKLAVVYRNHLLSYHQNATAAASAAEAAGLQGYWKEYADLLFENQAEWEYASASQRASLFNSYFTTVSNGKGDLDKFNSDIASEGVSKKISFDMGIGKRIDIDATPSFYFNGQKIDWTTASSIIVNGKTISWDSSRSGEKFVELLLEIAETNQ